MISNTDLASLGQKLNDYEKIVITGATGWLGSETSELFAQAIGDEFEKRLVLVSSEPKFVRIQNQLVQTIGWREFCSTRSVDLLVHFAFLNQEKALSMGLDNYIRINQRLTSDVSDFLGRNLGCDALVASSGAASHYAPDPQSANAMEVYAGLKKQGEDLFIENTNLVSLVNMRIWNVTGQLMGHQSPYAIADFLRQALATGVVKIHGNSASTRTYVDVREMMFVFLLSLESQKKITIDSGGFGVSFKNLAFKIAEQLELPKESIIFLGENQPVSLYNPDAIFFNNKANALGFKLEPIDSQVANLIKVFKTFF